MADGETRPWQAFAHRDYRVLWVVLVSGSIVVWLRVLGTAQWLLDETGSAMLVGLIGVVQLVVQIPALLWGGALADRVNRKRLMALAHLITSAALLLMGFLNWQGVLTPALVYVGIALTAVSQMVATPARSALVATVVPERHLLLATSTDTASQSAAAIAGPLLFAGVVVSAGLSSLFLAGYRAKGMLVLYASFAYGFFLFGFGSANALWSGMLTIAALGAADAVTVAVRQTTVMLHHARSYAGSGVRPDDPRRADREQYRYDLGRCLVRSNRCGQHHDPGRCDLSRRHESDLASLGTDPRVPILLNTGRYQSLADQEGTRRPVRDAKIRRVGSNDQEIAADFAEASSPVGRRMVCRLTTPRSSGRGLVQGGRAC